jgi:hypothetical protein
MNNCQFNSLKSHNFSGADENNYIETLQSEAIAMSSQRASIEVERQSNMHNNNNNNSHIEAIVESMLQKHM